MNVYNSKQNLRKSQKHCNNINIVDIFRFSYKYTVSKMLTSGLRLLTIMLCCSMAVHSFKFNHLSYNVIMGKFDKATESNFRKYCPSFETLRENRNVIPVAPHSTLRFRCRLVEFFKFCCFLLKRISLYLCF